VPDESPGAALVKAPETMQLVVVAAGVHAPRVTTYVPKPDPFPVPFKVMFCALWLRFKVTNEACAKREVSNKPPSMQQGVLWRSPSLPYLLTAFINEFPPR
jgi:hypothetical protein